MKIFFFIPCFFYNLTYGQKLEIYIYNKSGFDLDSVSVQNIYIGIIKHDSSKTIIGCDKLSLGFGVPSVSDIGIIHGKTKNYSDYVVYGPGLQAGPVGICGVGEYRTVSRGKFEFDIIYKDTKEGYWLYWKRHK